MILYRLICDQEHEFDGWFANSDAYEKQRESKLLSCPVCDSGSVSKALMTPGITNSPKRQKTPSEPQQAEMPNPVETAQQIQAMPDGPEKLSAIKTQLRALRRQVEENCDYVGNKFAEEALKIHSGEADARGIYGETTEDEAEMLREEGVAFGAVPWVRDDA